LKTNINKTRRKRENYITKGLGNSLTILEGREKTHRYITRVFETEEKAALTSQYLWSENNIKKDVKEHCGLCCSCSADEATVCSFEQSSTALDTTEG